MGEKPLGTCEVCKGKIYEAAVVLDDGKKKRCLGCHTCYGCRQKLSDASFFEKDGRCYCESCTTTKFSSLSLSDAPSNKSVDTSTKIEQKSHGNCQVCGKPVTLKSMSAGGKVFHPECFK